MARIRTIKPEFPQSESMGRISRDARLLFVELWTICDDSGRTRAASRMLASLLFPYDDDAPSLIDGWLDELESVGCVARYTADGASYLQVCNWLSHQKIDKPSQSKIPAFDESSRKLSKPREHSSLDQGSRIKDQGREATECASADADLLGDSKGATETPKSTAVEIDTWLATLTGDAIPATDPIFGYAKDVGIPLDFLELSWHRFVDAMRDRKKRQKDWRATYRNAVKDNWFKLWWFAPEGDCRLTTTGEQAKRALA